MSKSFYIKLTFAVYKVTQLFPKGESLAEEIRQKADETLIGLIRNDYKAYFEGVKSLNGLFDLAEKKGWIDQRNFQVLRREYAKVAKEKPAPVEQPVAVGDNSLLGSKNRRRQEAILDALKATGKIKLKDLARAFPNVTRRTLIRDLSLFCRSGLVERVGTGRSISYNIKNVTFFREMSQLA
jgi:hypothetical protein